MRVDVVTSIAVACCSCSAGAPWGLEPAPEDQEDAYSPRITAPDCRPNNDGVIERAEMPFVVNAAVRIRVQVGDLPVDVDGHVGGDGVRRWDFSLPDPTTLPLGRMELRPLEGYWFRDRFPQAQYAGFLVPGGSMLGAISVGDSAASLWGSGSSLEDPPEGRSLIIYDRPVTTYSFPLREGTRNVTTAQASNAELLGLPTALSDRYDIEVTARGTLVLPDLVLENTLRVTIRLERTLVAGDVRQVTHAWVHECLGEVARVISPPARLADTIPDRFPRAQEIWRLSL
jgi:hypothetical protein